VVDLLAESVPVAVIPLTPVPHACAVLRVCVSDARVPVLLCRERVDLPVSADEGHAGGTGVGNEDGRLAEALPEPVDKLAFVEGKLIALLRNRAWVRVAQNTSPHTQHTAHRTPHTAHRTPHTAHRTPHNIPRPWGSHRLWPLAAVPTNREVNTSAAVCARKWAPAA
jgi:hypothetical protein